MFRRIRGIITKITNYIGGKTGMYKNLVNITDHPDIKLTPEELQRIQTNKEFYKDVHEPVQYKNSNGDTAFRSFDSVNMSKIVSRKLAKIVFNEGVSVTIDKEQAQEFIDGVLEVNRFKQVFGEELEGGYAISGLTIVPVFDELSQTIKFTYCSADNFIPLDGNTNIITDAAIINRYRNIEANVIIYYTLFAIHKKRTWGYEIIHELYRSPDPAIVGQGVSLKTIQETQDLNESVRLDGLENPLFVYIKLSGKNNINYGSPLGLGVIDNARKQLCNFNRVYDQYMNEIDTSTRQLVASSEFFDVTFDHQGQPKKNFDPKVQVYQKVNSEDPFIQDFSPELRATQFIESLNFILRIIEMDTGFSSGTFSFDGKSVKTATEVISENTDTYQTRADNVLIIEQALSDLVDNCFYLGDYYGIYKGESEANITIDFDDGVFTSKTNKQAYAMTGAAAGLMSIRTAMKKAYGWDDEEANEEYAKILEERQQANPEGYQQRSETEIFGASETAMVGRELDIEDIDSETSKRGSVRK